MNKILILFASATLIAFVAYLIYILTKSNKIEGFQTMFSAPLGEGETGDLQVSWDKVKGTEPITYYWRWSSSESDSAPTKDSDWVPSGYQPEAVTNTASQKILIKPNTQFWFQVYAENTVGKSDVTTVRLTSPSTKEITSVGIIIPTSYESKDLCFGVGISGKIPETPTIDQYPISAQGTVGDKNIFWEGSNISKGVDNEIRLCNFFDENKKSFKLIPGDALDITFSLRDPTTQIVSSKVFKGKIPGIMPSSVDSSNINVKYIQP